MQSTQQNLEQLAKKVASAMPDFNGAGQRIAVALYRQLAQGKPVSPEKVAENLDLSSDLVLNTLESWPGVFYDEEKNVVGFWGLAQRETPHRFKVGGKQLYTWCAWDSLFIPRILGKTAYVESTCRTTGERISLTLSPDRVQEVSPSGAVVSFLTPDTPFDANVVLSFCHYILFFSSEEAGTKWTAEHKNTFLLSVEEAYEVGRLTNRANFGDALARTN